MTWLAPWALIGGGFGMLGIVAAHLLSRQRPRALALATARFLPSGMLEATTVQRMPRDIWWMLLRLLIVALLAAGVAQPVLTGRKVPVRTVLLLDRTLPDDAQRAALTALASTDVVIAFDTVATLQSPTDSVRMSRSGASLSAALGRLVRVRDSLALGAEEMRVLVASRFTPRSLDPATPTLRALVRDSIGVVKVSVPVDSTIGLASLTVRADGDDPVAATVVLLGDTVARAGTSIDRRLTPDTSALLDNPQHLVVVHWPARVTTGAPVLQAVTVGGATWVAPLGRDSTAVPPRARAIGWWADGTPAVWQREVGNGCVITVHVALPPAGDHTLSLAAQRWLRTLVRSCDGESDGVHTAPDWLAPAPARTAANASQQVFRSFAAPWLLAGALVLATLELVLRTVKRA